jgi:hypothetical protein
VRVRRNVVSFPLTPALSLEEREKYYHAFKKFNGQWLNPAQGDLIT